MDRSLRLVAWVVALTTCLLVPSIARAHPLVEEGRRLYDEAEFSRAIEVLSQALAARDLSREDLVRLLEVRVLVNHALGNRAASELDLRRLASLEPEHVFGPDTPPELLEAFVSLAVRAAVAVEVHVDRTASHAEISASIHDDPTRLVSHVVVAARTQPGVWSREEDSALSLAVDESSPVECYALAIGLGGATIASRGSEAEPIVLAPEATVNPGPEPKQGFPWLWTGAAALAVAALATSVVLLWPTPTTSETQPTRPGVDWP